MYPWCIQPTLPGYQANLEPLRQDHTDKVWGPVRHNQVDAVKGLLEELARLGEIAKAWGYPKPKRDVDVFISLVRSGFFSNLALCAIILEPDLDPVVGKYLDEILRERIGPEYTYKALGPMEILGRHAASNSRGTD